MIRIYKTTQTAKAVCHKRLSESQILADFADFESRMTRMNADDMDKEDIATKVTKGVAQAAKAPVIKDCLNRRFHRFRRF